MRGGLQCNHAEAFRVTGNFADGKHVDVCSAVDGSEFAVVGNRAEKKQVVPNTGVAGGCSNAVWRLCLGVQRLIWHVPNDQQHGIWLLSDNTRKTSLNEFPQAFASGQAADREQQRAIAKSMLLAEGHGLVALRIRILASIASRQVNPRMHDADARGIDPYATAQLGCGATVGNHTIGPADRRQPDRAVRKMPDSHIETVHVNGSARTAYSCGAPHYWRGEAAAGQHEIGFPAARFATRQ
jgi:hypothetical protein